MACRYHLFQNLTMSTGCRKLKIRQAKTKPVKLHLRPSNPQLTPPTPQIQYCYSLNITPQITQHLIVKVNIAWLIIISLNVTCSRHEKWRFVLNSNHWLTHSFQEMGSSWSWSHGQLIYNQCLSPFKLSARITLLVRCTRYNIMWYSLSVTCGRSVVSSTNESDHHNTTTILLKVALNTITLTLTLRRALFS